MPWSVIMRYNVGVVIMKGYKFEAPTPKGEGLQ